MKKKFNYRLLAIILLTFFNNNFLLKASLPTVDPYQSHQKHINLLKDLVMGALTGDSKRIEAALDSGVRYSNLGSEDLRRVLLGSARHGDFNAVEKAIQAEAQVNPLNPGWDAHDYYDDDIQCLVKSGSPLIDPRYTKHGINPLKWAKASGHEAITKFLYAHGAEDDWQNSD
jgi:ankyrin repeat protein